MRFLVDNSLSLRMAVNLAAAGHEAIHTRDIGMAAADDESILDEGQRRGCVVLSEDTDFGALLPKRKSSQPLVILFRCERKTVDALAPILLNNLGAIAGDLDAGAIVVIEETRLRVRRLPLVRPNAG